jgi:hypothetical protein
VTAESAGERRRISAIYQRLFGRPATVEECQVGVEILQHARNTRSQLADAKSIDVQSGSWQDLCMALICSNEFLYLD